MGAICEHRIFLSTPHHHSRCMLIGAYLVVVTRAAYDSSGGQESGEKRSHKHFLAFQVRVFQQVNTSQM